MEYFLLVPYASNASHRLLMGGLELSIGPFQGLLEGTLAGWGVSCLVPGLADLSVHHSLETVRSKYRTLSEFWGSQT